MDNIIRHLLSTKQKTLNEISSTVHYKYIFAFEDTFEWDWDYILEKKGGIPPEKVVYVLESKPVDIKRYKNVIKKLTLNVPLECIDRNPDWNWNWGVDGLSAVATPEFVNRHSTKRWYWGSKRSDTFTNLVEGLSSNPNVTPEFIEQYADKDWNWNELSMNPNVTSALVQRHLDKAWNWERLSENKNLDPEFIHTYARTLGDFYRLSTNPRILLKTLEEYKNEEWNWSAISSYNSSLTPEFVKCNLTLDWNWGSILQRFPCLCEVYTYKVKCQDVPLIFLRQYIRDSDWNWKKLSETVGLDFIRCHPEGKWKWDIVLKRKVKKNKVRSSAWVYASFLYANLTRNVSEFILG